MLLMAATVPHSSAGHNPTYVLASPHQDVTFDIERLFQGHKDAHKKLDLLITILSALAATAVVAVTLRPHHRSLAVAALAATPQATQEMTVPAACRRKSIS